MGFVCQKLNTSEIGKLTELVGLYERVFEMQDFQLPPQDYLQSLLENDQIVFYVAVDDEGIVIGGLTAYMLPSVYYSASEVYIYDLAVENAWQRMGIGRNLIEALKNYGKSLGCKYIFVQADLVDQHAIDFYHSTGGIKEDVVHFDYRL